MQKRTRKNYMIYVLMLLLFGGLIYVAIEEGGRFARHAVDTLNGAQGSPFTLFLQFIEDNLHHSLTTLLIQIIAVLLMVRLFGYLFNLIGQPGVIGEIVAGIVLGPSVVGFFFPDAFLFLFPAHSLTNLELLSQVGLILFMFVIGMELDFSVLKNKINETLVISHAGILVPFFLGILSSFWIYETYVSSQTSFLPFALFGAFMAGVVMPSNLGFRKVMMEKVEDISLVFFLPLFFAFTGLRTQIGLINSLELWMVCLLLVTVAIVGKLGGCAIAARLVGESWKDSLTIGTLMNTRGVMELIALNIGYEMGVLPPPIFVILVIMALVTTFMTTPLLHLVERFFVRREEKLSLKRKLIFCFGRPDSGRNLLSIYSLLFGEKLKKRQLIAAHYTVGTDLSPLNAESYASESFALINRRATELDLSVDNHYRVTDKLVPEMIHFIRKEHPDMLLLGAGSHHRADRLGTPGTILWLPLFRDKIDEIMEQVKCPVAVFVNRNYREDEAVMRKLSSLLVIHRNKNNRKKDE